MIATTLTPYEYNNILAKSFRPIFIGTPLLIKNAFVKTPSKRNMKTKIDITEYKKLCKALLIMFIDANTKLDPNFKKENTELEVELKVNKYGAKDKFSVRKTSKRSKRGFVALDSKFIPTRCEAIAKHIRKVYPRLSDIALLDRRVVISSSEASEEGIQWAEYVSSQAGVSIKKDTIVSAKETIVKHHKSIVRSDKNINAVVKLYKAARFPTGNSLLTRATRKVTKPLIEEVQIQEL